MKFKTPLYKRICCNFHLIFFFLEKKEKLREWKLLIIYKQNLRNYASLIIPFFLSLLVQEAVDGKNAASKN